MVVFNINLTRFRALVRFAIPVLPLSLFALMMPPLLPSAKADVGVGVNGGILADAGDFHIEFIGGAAYALMLFAVSDKRQKPLSAQGISAYVLVDQNGQSTRLRLSPEADNLLAAVPDLPLLAGTTVLVVAKLVTGETLKARFVSP